MGAREPSKCMRASNTFEPNAVPPVDMCESVVVSRTLHGLTNMVGFRFKLPTCGGTDFRSMTYRCSESNTRPVPVKADAVVTVPSRGGGWVTTDKAFNIPNTGANVELRMWTRVDDVTVDNNTTTHGSSPREGDGPLSSRILVNGGRRLDDWRLSMDARSGGGRAGVMVFRK